MEKFNVTGMSCASCSSHVEKAVSSIKGVDSCTVSLLTNSMNVEGSADPKDIIKAVTDAGYGASLQEKQAKIQDNTDLLEDNETPKLLRRLVASVLFLLILMYFSMGHMMFNFPLPPFFENNHLAIGIIELILTSIVMVINQDFFISGFKGIINKMPNMDSLVALGSSASFIYSVYALLLISDGYIKDNMDQIMYYSEELYFESAAMILALITIGKMLEAKSKGKTTNALKGLMKLKPKTANVLVNNIEQTINIEDLKIDDIFIIRPGEAIPTDGIVIEGITAIDESALTGESIPVEKTVNDSISAGTINQNGFIKAKATKVGSDTTLSQIIEMVSNAAATKVPIAKVTDKVSAIFVPAICIISLITLAVWLLIGKPFGYAIERAIAVLVISCPCALGLATPVAIMVGNGVGAKNGILFKNAAALEETGKVNIIALDKTGTITSGNPTVTDIITVNNITEKELLKIAYSLEKNSEHPLAKAICNKALEENCTAYEVTDFTALVGLGIKGYIDNDLYIVGNQKAIGKLSSNIYTLADKLSLEGKTPLYFKKNQQLIGIIAVADQIKNDSFNAIKQMQKMGMQVVMITGDNKKTAEAIGKEAGVNKVIAEVLPEGKESIIRQLKDYGKVAMIGDGINDSPALTSADIGIAIGAGSDIAIDAADVVLLKSNLTDAVASIRLSKATLRIIHENLFWAFGYNIIGIPLAAGVFISLLNWKLNPMFGAASMSLSSFLVVSNALRLNCIDIYSDKHDKNNKTINLDKIVIKEERKTTKTITIEGMMCQHCEATVKKALEKLESVESADVSFEKGVAIVTLCNDVSDDKLKKTIEDKDYTVISIK